MKGPMARFPRRRRQLRVASPLDIRAWVTEPDAAGVYEELCHRIDTLEAVGKPGAALFVQGGPQLATTTLAMHGRTEEFRELTHDEKDLLIRSGVANMIAAYWARHEYRRGR